MKKLSFLMIVSIISLILVGCSSIKKYSIISSNDPEDYLHDYDYVECMYEFELKVDEDYDNLCSDEQIKNDIKEKIDEANEYELHTKEAKEIRKAYGKSMKEYNEILKDNPEYTTWGGELNPDDQEKIENLEKEFEKKRDAFYDKYDEVIEDLKSKYNKENE